MRCYLRGVQVIIARWWADRRLLSGAAFNCGFNGTAVNQGAGCATNVRGSTLTYDANHVQVGSQQWFYSFNVKPGERFIYQWPNLAVPAGAGWTYNTQVAWDNVSCQ